MEAACEALLCMSSQEGIVLTMNRDQFIQDLHRDVDQFEKWLKRVDEENTIRGLSPMPDKMSGADWFEQFLFYMQGVAK